MDSDLITEFAAQREKARRGSSRLLTNSIAIYFITGIVKIKRSDTLSKEYAVIMGRNLIGEVWSGC